jgi:hypothetical protein
LQESLNRFAEKAHVEFSEDGTKVMLLCSLWRITVEYGIIEVPMGFWSDGASIPRAFWAILNPFGRYFESAIVHDYLYTMGTSLHGGTRKKADITFLELMEKQNVVSVVRRTMWLAVRMFGWKQWKKYEKERNKANETK